MGVMNVGGAAVLLFALQVSCLAAIDHTLIWVHVWVGGWVHVWVIAKN